MERDPKGKPTGRLARRNALCCYLCLIVWGFSSGPLQVYYSLWRKLLKAFWWLVVAYTMLVLIAVYTFQFEDFPVYWRNFTGLTDEQ